MDKVLESFLRRQHDDAREFAAASDIVTIEALGAMPSQHYVVTFRAKGLIRSTAGDIVAATGAAFGIHLPDEYLRHVDPLRIVTYLGPHRTPWHPNIRAPVVCVRPVPGTPLVDLLYACYELWTWQLYYTGDNGLNPDASRWARHEDPSRFPIDGRPLKRRKLAITVTPVPRKDEQS